VWADLSEEMLGAIDAAADPGQKIKLITEAVGVRHYADNARSAIMVDFYLYNIVFCDESGFSTAKKSAFFSIMKLVFAHAFDAVDEVTTDASLEFFKQRVLAHAVESPAEGRAGVFSLSDAKLMVGFVGKTFYRNFRAYKLCFTTRQETESATRFLAVETPMIPNPLDQGDLDGE
jgi:hypothetical protein